MGTLPATRLKGNLPSELAEFVGRSRQLVQIREILARTRLLTLTGVGGVGKSRLAVRSARRLERSFKYGVWFVELAALGDGRLVSSAALRALGVPEKPNEPFESSIAAFLRGGPALLVVDNCEHVLDPVAELVLSLLEACPELVVLATSREPLGVEGEATLSVPPLDLPKAGAVVRRPEEALSFGAVELFAARASAANPAFAIGEENVGDVVEICRRLEGIPLGLELAAVRMRTLSLAGLRKLLDDQLSLSNLNGRSALARHRTLTATLDWSYDLLNEAERALWHRLAVFSGGFTIDAAERVCSDDELPAATVFDTLTGLLEKSVVVIEREGGAARYRLLEPIRLYGSERLRRSGAEIVLRTRHLDWCLAWTAELEQWSSGLSEQELHRIVEEHANLLGALDFSLGEPGLAARGLALLEQVSRAWLLCEWFRELTHYGEALLQIDSDEWRDRARVGFTLGMTALIHGDLADARRRLEECCALTAGRRDCDLERGLASLGLAILALWEGKREQAARRFGRAIERFERVSATTMHVQSLLSLASSAMRAAEDRPAARSLIERALTTNEQGRDIWNRGFAHALLGELELLEGRPKQAEANFLQSLRLKKGISHRTGIAINLQGLALAAVATGRYAYAAQLLGAVDALADDLDVSISHFHEAAREAAEEEARTALGVGRYGVLYAEGAALRLPDAIRLGLGESAGRRSSSSQSRVALTRRESEIARLVAAGATNRRIASTLVISDQTVKFHVHNILGKLGFESRAEIAAWEARQSVNQ